MMKACRSGVATRFAFGPYHRVFTNIPEWLAHYAAMPTVQLARLAGPRHDELGEFSLSQPDIRYAGGSP